MCRTGAAHQLDVEGPQRIFVAGARDLLGQVQLGEGVRTGELDRFDHSVGHQIFACQSVCDDLAVFVKGDKLDLRLRRAGAVGLLKMEIIVLSAAENAAISFFQI